MITKDDFVVLIGYLKVNGKISDIIDINAKWNEFVEKRENSDYINDIESDDARYDAEMELVDEILGI